MKIIKKGKRESAIRYLIGQQITCKWCDSEIEIEESDLETLKMADLWKEAGVYKMSIVCPVCFHENGWIVNV